MWGDFLTITLALKLLYFANLLCSKLHFIYGFLRQMNVSFCTDLKIKTDS
jgi:hypothetical protein